MKSPSRPRASSGVLRLEADSRQDAGADLLSFLSDRMMVSRRAAKRLLDERFVFVNGRRLWMARHRLRAGDQVEVRRPAAYAAVLLPSILVETPDAIIVDKPAGLLSLGDAQSAESRLREVRGEPGLAAVHRLDRETSGCLWLARSAEVRDLAIRLFREGRVHKIYEALVLGRFPDARARLDSPMDGRSAVTWIERVAISERATRLRVRIETGRTHQIRKHLLEAGFPIAGDKQYGASRRLADDLRDLPRQMLHAAELEAPLSETTTLCARAPLPSDFRRALRQLGFPG